MSLFEPKLTIAGKQDLQTPENGCLAASLMRWRLGRECKGDCMMAGEAKRRLDNKTMCSRGWFPLRGPRGCTSKVS